VADRSFKVFQGAQDSQKSSCEETLGTIFKNQVSSHRTKCTKGSFWETTLGNLIAFTLVSHLFDYIYYISNVLSIFYQTSGVFAVCAIGRNIQTFP